MSNNRNYYWCTNGITNKKIKTLNDIPEGYHEGRTCVPWNKGLTKETNETLAYISKTVSEKTKGRTAPNKGKPASEKQKLKQSMKMKEKYETKEIVVWNKGLTKEVDSRIQSVSEKMTGHPGYTSPEAVQKMLESKRKNKSFNTSQLEEKLFEDLKLKYPELTVLRQYKDKERYPFCCDFYIVEKDLFVELNAHWTHGGKPFDSKNPDCLTQLKDWKKKALTSDYYNYAIKVWTESDVKKQKCAKEHNLNYQILYNYTSDIII